MSNEELFDGETAGFRMAWIASAQDGLCDGEGGMEHRRVVREWVEAGRPLPAAAFIVQRASAGPDGSPRVVVQ